MVAAHVGYGMVLGPDGHPFKTREGGTVSRSRTGGYEFVHTPETIQRQIDDLTQRLEGFARRADAGEDVRRQTRYVTQIRDDFVKQLADLSRAA